MRRIINLLGFLLGCACIIAAICLLSGPAWELYGTNIVAGPEQDSLVKTFESETAMVDAPVTGELSEEGADTVPAVDLHYGEMFGELRIPRFGDDYAKPLLEATDEATLKQGVGHYIGTAGPCQIGNFAIAAHRTTYGAAFRDVEQLKEGDEIFVKTQLVNCTYVVESFEIVDPSEVSVIAAVPGQPGVKPSEAYLTITTCHPMYSAHERYVVHARLVDATVEP
ncbi:MAG: class E sortase [Patescibacteria group bacterium]